MTCDELRGFYELYALGLLEDPERSEAAAHIGRNCPNCVPEYKKARELNAVLLASLPEAAPSPQLRRRILASVGAGPGRSGLMAWLPYALAIVPALIVGLVLAGRLRERDQQLAQRDASIRSAEAAHRDTLTRLQRSETVVSFLQAPDTRQVTFGKGPQGRVLVHATRGVLLLANNLPPAGPGKAYEMWIIPKGGAPRPAGVFQSDPSGNALHIAAGPVDLGATGAIAVTVEPEAGSPAPTTTPFIVAPLAD